MKILLEVVLKEGKSGFNNSLSDICIITYPNEKKGHLHSAC